MTPSSAGVSQEWHIVTCEYPPTIGGVSDYTFTLAAGLGETGPVHVWCPSGTGAVSSAGNVAVHRTFQSFSRRELRSLSEELDRRPGPRRLFVQWVPQGFGYRSLNLGFALWLAGRARRQGDQVHLMVHEPFLPWSASPIHLAVSLVHRAMLAAASFGATRVWLSTSTWKDAIRPYVRARVQIEWLPVPAPTLPNIARHVGGERARSGLTVGHFGTHSPLVTALLEPALDLLLQQTEARVLLVGRDSDTFRESFIRTRPLVAVRVLATGVLSQSELVRQLGTCDLMLQPYPDGITTRRTSTLTLLSLGMPVVSNTGHLSEPFWNHSGAIRLADAPDGRLIAEAAVALLADPLGRADLARRARDLYDQRFAARHGVAILNAAAWPQRHAA